MELKRPLFAFSLFFKQMIKLKPEVVWITQQDNTAFEREN